MNRVVTGLVVVAVAVLSAAAGWVAWQQWQEAQRLAARAAAGQAVDTYVTTWEDGDFQRLGRVTTNPPAAARAHRQMIQALQAREVTAERRGLSMAGATATSAYRVRMRLPGLGEWSYEGRLALAPDDEGTWRVVWAPEVLHPQLAAGQRFARTREWPERGTITAADGAVLAQGSDEVVIGLRGVRLEDPARARRALVRHAGAAPGRARRQVRRARNAPDGFVPVIGLPRVTYEQVRDQLAPVPGVFFEARSRYRAAGQRVPGVVLGRTGILSPERVEQLGPPYVEGDIGGVSGLESAFERRLAGKPGGEIRIVDGDGAVVEVLRRFDPEPAGAVQASVDLRLQRAAEQALEGTEEPAAMVVLHAPTGRVRAVANAPATGFNRALLGQYPPGSTFKVVTTTALLASGTATPSTRVTCPLEARVGGLVFGNAGDEQLGEVRFREAFFRSCNTAFVQLADRLEPGQLLQAAERLGFNRTYEPGVPAMGGSFPEPGDAAEHAAAAIGQARVLASPLQMAAVAAAVADGRWHPPTFVDSDQAEGVRLPQARTLRRLMRLVVRQGTGTAAAVDGQRIGGKTGTAEFGTDDPPETHAWFIGFRGDLALAVVVEAGGFGGEVAAPAAARFFESVTASG